MNQYFLAAMKANKRNIKTILVTISLLLTVCSSQAQFGIRIGAGASDIVFLKYGQSPYLSFDNNSVEHNFPAPSFQIGAIRHIELSNKLDLTSALLISKQGLDYSQSYVFDDIKYRLHISYLKLPVLLKVKTNILKNRKSGILVGPYIGARIDATMVTRVNGTSHSYKKDNVSIIDMGIISGYSWDIGKDPGSLFIDIRCSYSLLNMMQTLDGAPSYNTSTKEYARNITILLAIEYMF